MRHPNYVSDPLGVATEVGMVKEPADERRHFVLSNTGDNQAVATMAESRNIKTGITREKGWIALTPQQDDNFIVLLPLSTNFNTNLSCADPCSLKQ